MEHSVITAFGESTLNYGGDKWVVPLNPPPQGLGQGNGAATKIWAIFSMPLLNCLRDTGHGTVFKCCISQELLNLVGYCFVNDYIIINISPSPNTPNTYTLKLYQEGLYLYSGPAQAMGGKFSATKTKWNLLEFK